jgi:signal transduction histidine kinase
LGVDAAWLEISDRDRRPVAVYGIGQAQVQEIIELFRYSPVIYSTDNVIIKSIRKGEAPNQIFCNHASIPITFSGKNIATLNIVSKDEINVSEERIPFIQSFANLCAVALQNTWLFGEVQSSNKQLHALSQHLISSQEKERLHLSREIHDESGQLISAMTVQLGLLEREIRKGVNVDQKLADLKLSANSIQNNLHQIAVNLRPTSLDHLGLVTALKQYSEDFTRQYEIDIRFEAIGIQNQRLSESIETALFRIVQESLTNVVLHADASHVDVLIYFRNNHVVAIIEDDGVGFAPTSPTLENHLGILGMRERVEMLKGNFSIESSHGNGTTVYVEVPIDN